MNNSKILAGKTILVVDDEPDLREIVAEEFELSGARVLQAQNGREAFSLVEREKIDAVVSDIRMPGGDGVELLKRVRERNPETPVLILITGYSDLTPSEAFDWGAEAIFNKPCPLDKLISAVEHALRPRDERFKRIRERFDIAVKVEVRSPGIKEAMKTATLNIGRGGAFVCIPSGSLPEAGAEVQFRFLFDDGMYSPIEGDSICRWVRQEPVGDKAGVRPRGAGIEFIGMNKTSIQNLAELLNEIKTKSFIPQS